MHFLTKTIFSKNAKMALLNPFMGFLFLNTSYYYQWIWISCMMSWFFLIWIIRSRKPLWLSVIYHPKERIHKNSSALHVYRWRFNEIRIQIFPPIFPSAETRLRHRDLSWEPPRNWVKSPNAERILGIFSAVFPLRGQSSWDSCQFCKWLKGTSAEIYDQFFIRTSWASTPFC